ncbi:hypothetical protein OC835_004590 [Tilletia horrida]|nr:hypothetical protein OC835_004590 [Tilletia horrida]
MEEPPGDASARAQDTGTGVPQAQASPKVSYPENNKFVECDSSVRSALAPKLNGAGSPSADTLIPHEADAAFVQREPPSPPTPQGARRQDQERGGEAAETGMDVDPATAPESGNASWADMMTADEDAAVAAAGAATASTDAARTRPATPTEAGKRKEPDGTPRKDRDEEERRMVLHNRRAEAAMPPPSLPSLTVRRSSSRIAENNIAPASGRQQVVSGVSRIVAGTEKPDWASAPPSAGATPPPAPGTSLPTPAGAPSSAPTGKAGPARITPSTKPARPFQALDQLIDRNLEARQKREDTVQDFLKGMSTGLQAMDGLNALPAGRISAARTLSTALAKVVLGAADSTALPAEVLAFLDSWDPQRPCPPLPVQPSTAAPAFPSSPSPYLSAARAGAPAQKPTQRPLRPEEGYRLQGASRSDVEQLVENGGVKDLRTFVRLPPNSAFRGEDPLSLRQQLEAVAASHTAKKLTFARVKKVNSGFSFTPGPGCSPEDFQLIYTSIQTRFAASAVEGPCPHTRFCLRGIPAHIISGGQAKVVTPAILQDYLQLRFPTAIFAALPRIISTGDDEFPLWLLTIAGTGLYEHDGNPLSSRFALMDRDCMIRPYRSTNASKHCGKCLSWHHTEHRCRALAAVCAHCGLTGHSSSNHACKMCAPGSAPKCIPQCFHCKGPFPTGHTACPARPVWRRKVNAVVVPSGERLQRIQTKGRADYKQALSRARATSQPSNPVIPTSTNAMAQTRAPEREMSAQTGATGASVPGTSNTLSSASGAPTPRPGPAPDSNPTTLLGLGHTTSIIASSSSSASGPRDNALGAA